MFARVTVSQAAPNLSSEAQERIARYIREQIIPNSRKVPGFKGGYWLADRKTGKGLTVTIWDTEQAEQASQAAAAQARQQAATALNLESRALKLMRYWNALETSFRVSLSDKYLTPTSESALRDLSVLSSL